MVKEVYFFTEMGYTAYPQDDARRRGHNNLMFPNEHFNPERAQQLYGMYFEELQYCTESGFDGVMINEHHNNPLSMMPSVNVIGAVLARTTRKGRIVFLGNVLPIHDNPLRVAEEVAMIDILSGGRVICGFVRGLGQESIATNANPIYNRERFDEAHNVIVKAWTFPMGGSALRVPSGQSVGQTPAKASSPDLDSRRGQPGVGQVGGRAPLPVRGAGPAAARHRRDLRSLRRGRGPNRIHSDLRAARIRHPGERRRHRRRGLRAEPALLLAAGDVVRGRAPPLAAAPGVREPGGHAEPA